MWIELSRPLIIFDLETTGTSISTDRIVELFYIKLYPDGNREEKHYLLNPKIPISPKASEIHGYRDEDVKDCLTFQDIAGELAIAFTECDFAGFNSNKFDFPMLVEEFLRVGVEFDITRRKFVDVQRIFHTLEPRNLGAAYKFYCDKDLLNAHSARADVNATLEVLASQIEKYKERLGSNIDKLHEFSGQTDNADLAGRIKFNEDGKEYFAFGKHKGKLVHDVFIKEPSYYDWIMNADFSMDTKRVVTRIRLRSFGNK
jgi:DNA polymerase-3 subunit epsilon